MVIIDLHFLVIIVYMYLFCISVFVFFKKHQKKRRVYHNISKGEKSKHFFLNTFFLVIVFFFPSLTSQ